MLEPRVRENFVLRPYNVFSNALWIRPRYHFFQKNKVWKLQDHLDNTHFYLNFFSLASSTAFLLLASLQHFNFRISSRFETNKSTKGASKLRRDLINAEIANLRDLLPLPQSTRQRLSQLQLMALVCVYVRKANYFQQGRHIFIKWDNCEQGFDLFSHDFNVLDLLEGILESFIRGLIVIIDLNVDCVRSTFHIRETTL